MVCSGERGCVIESGARAQWNETCQKRASRLYETVQGAVKREVGLRANVLTIAKEAQKRGAVHFHYALGVETALELRAAKAFRRHLERLSQKRRYCFGHVHGKFVRPRPAREAAAYLSSYFLGGRGHKAKLTEAVHNAELPRMPLYVSRRLTSVTKTTMRNKRRQRHAWVCLERGRGMPAWWERPGGEGRRPLARRSRCDSASACDEAAGDPGGESVASRGGSAAEAARPRRDATHTAEACALGCAPQLHRPVIALLALEQTRLSVDDETMRRKGSS